MPWDMPQAKPTKPKKKTTSRAPRPAAAQHVAAVLDALRRAYPAAECALVHDSPYQLAVATILSAQCTDKRVNMVTPSLFARFPTPADLASARLEDVEAEVASINFFRNKARALVGMAQRVCNVHGGEIPRTLGELIELPGIARKTANVVLSVGYGLCEGIVVDTHVRRVSGRLGLSDGSTPEKVEQQLMACVPRPHWMQLSHELIELGRQVCLARSPRCPSCALQGLCPSAAP
jgi:endonuclease-3